MLVQRIRCHGKYGNYNGYIYSDSSKGSLHKQIKTPLVGEHDFPMTRFVCKTAHVTSRI